MNLECIKLPFLLALRAFPVSKKMELGQTNSDQSSVTTTLPTRWKEYPGRAGVWTRLLTGKSVMVAARLQKDHSVARAPGINCNDRFTLMLGVPLFFKLWLVAVAFFGFSLFFLGTRVLEESGIVSFSGLLLITLFLLPFIVVMFVTYKAGEEEVLLELRQVGLFEVH